MAVRELLPLQAEPMTPQDSAGAGEIPEELRAFDWSSTPLGPVDRWPEALRAAVNAHLGRRTHEDVRERAEALAGADRAEEGRLSVELPRVRGAAEAELERLRSLLAQVPAVVNFLRGPDLVYEVAHPRLVESLGGRPIQGVAMREAFPEVGYQPFLAMIREAYETGRAVSKREAPLRRATSRRDSAGTRTGTSTTCPPSTSAARSRG